MVLVLVNYNNPDPCVIPKSLETKRCTKDECLCKEWENMWMVAEENPCSRFPLCVCETMWDSKQVPVNYSLWENEKVTEIEFHS